MVCAVGIARLNSSVMASAPAAGVAANMPIPELPPLPDTLPVPLLVFTTTALAAVAAPPSGPPTRRSAISGRGGARRGAGRARHRGRSLDLPALAPDRRAARRRRPRLDLQRERRGLGLACVHPPRHSGALD